jgi:outer membrane protein TolC
VKTAHNPRRSWAPAVAGLALAAVSALAQAQVSLTTVVELAQRNSTTVRLAEADVQKASAALGESRDAFIPSVDFGSGLPAFPEVGFTGSLPTIWDASVGSVVFSMPQIRAVKAARQGLQAAQLALKDAREQVALEASTTYIEMDIVSRELDAARQQEVYASRLVDIEQERTDAGVDPLSDLLQARLAAAQLKLHRLHLETREATLSKQLSALTGLPSGSIAPDHGSIPEIPAVTADDVPRTTEGVESAQSLALAKKQMAKGDEERQWFPQISFGILYNRNTTLLNTINKYYASPLPANDLSSGFSLQIPVFDMGMRAKARESAADALRARVEAEEAQHRNDVVIATLTASLRELDTMAEIATLKDQIAGEQLKTVLAQLELGNGAGIGPGAPSQLSPKAEQLARIDERQKYIDSLDAEMDLSRARLGLLRALGHMQDWLNTLNTR